MRMATTVTTALIATTCRRAKSVAVMTPEPSAPDAEDGPTDVEPIETVPSGATTGWASIAARTSRRSHPAELAATPVPLRSRA